MSLLCRCYERKLSVLAVSPGGASPSGSLLRHLGSCAHCASAWREYQQLTGRLNRISEPRIDGESLSLAIWPRISAIESNRKSRLLQPAFIVLAALFMFVWGTQAPTGNSSSYRPNTQASAPMPARIKVTFAKTTEPTRPTVSRKANNRTANRGRSERRKHRIRHRKVQTVVARAALVETAEFSKRIDTRPVVQWEYVGAWYEAVGDHQSAAAAYAAAFETRPTPALAFTTGRAAECAGDLSTAVEYYARALDAPQESESEPTKGSSKCINERSSV